MKTAMIEKATSNHEEWIEILKYVIIYVAPTIAAVWKITSTYGDIQKQRLTESLQQAVRAVVEPKFDAIEDKMDEIKKQADKDREIVNSKFYELIKEIKK